MALVAFALCAIASPNESGYGGVVVVQNVAPSATNWPGTPIVQTLTNPMVEATVGESFNSAGGNTNHSQTFTVISNNYTLQAIDLYVSYGTGTGAGTNITLNLYDLGMQTAPGPSPYTATIVGANLLGSGSGLSITYMPQPDGILELDFTGLDQVVLQAGHMYAFELTGVSGTTPLYWNRATSDTYLGGAAYRNQAWINGNNARDFALAVYGALSTNPSWPQDPTAALPDLRLSRAGTINAMAVQDDGQIVIGGSFTSVNDVPVTNLARINASGAVDSVWTPNPDGPVTALATAGTRLFVGGDFYYIGGQFRNGLALLSTAGLVQVDPTWAPIPYTFPGLPAISALALDGTNLFVGGYFQSIGGQSRSNIAKVTITGSGVADSGWDPGANAAVNALLVNGTDLYVGGSFTQIGGNTNRNRLAKLNTTGNGAADASWNPSVDSSTPFPYAGSSVSKVVLNGSNLFVSGQFTNVGGLARVNLAKVTASGGGAVNATWNPNADVNAGAFALATSGANLFVGGHFTQIGGQNATNLAAIGTGGSGSLIVNWAPRVNAPVNALLVDGTWLLTGGNFSLVNNNTIALGIAKLDLATAVSDEGFSTQVSAPGTVNAIVRQADGKIIVGGDFWLSGQVVRPHLARINADGTLDGTWEPATDGTVNALAVTGTNLFVGGVFANIGGKSRNGLAKVDVGGTDLVDSAWNPGTTSSAEVYALAADAGKVYIGGRNLGINGQNSISFARASASGNGVADTNWTSVADGAVRSILISGTNVFVGGEFNTIHGQARPALARFNTTGNGTVDTSWNANVVGGYIYALALDNTSLFLGGYFGAVGGQNRGGLAKVSLVSTGVVDSAWNPAASFPYGVVTAQALAAANGNLYVGGIFGTNPMNLARIGAAGTGVVDTGWHPNPFTGGVNALLSVGQDLYVGGAFQYIGGSSSYAPDAAARNGFALLAVADAPVMIQSSVNNFFLVPNAADGPEVTHFRITGISGGSLFLKDGVTPVHAGDFISVAQGAEGLVFAGSSGLITAVSALNDTPNGAGTAATTLNLGSAQAPVFSFSSPTYSVTEDGGFVVVSVRKQGIGAASVNYATADGTAVATGPASTLVVPNALANVEGNSGNFNPFNKGTNTMRYQQVYAASQFGTVPVGGAWITAIAFRADAGWGGFATTLPAIQINLSTTAKAPDGLSVTFTNNVGANDTVVFNGPLTLSSAATGNPRAFDIVIPLTTPFFYNPAAGNLLLDVRNTGGGLTTQFDAVNANGDSVSRVDGVPASATSGDPPDSLGLVTQFTLGGSTPPLTGGPDYTNTSGTLSFGVSDTNMDIVIGIINDAVFEGDESFSINLSNPIGAGIAFPGTATVTIVENDPIGSAGSYTTTGQPGALPSATGSLTVHLLPPAASGQWRLAGQGSWNGSGSTLNNLVSGNYRVEFRPVTGYRAPDAMIAPVASGTNSVRTNSYSLISNAASGVGNISLLICPDDVATNTDVSLRGQWRVQGTVPWFNSGEFYTNLPPDSYRVEFKDVPNLVTPDAEDLTVYADETVRITRLYRVTTEGNRGLPNLVSFESATTNRPYVFVGQIQTDLGFGSGVVVKDHVVLTAAHLLFDGGNLSFVGQARWSFQRYSGRYEPVSQIPRGWHVFEGYSAQRQLDPDSCVQSVQSQNLDVAAMYFLESAGRGGFGGYLVSDNNTNWLSSSRQKILAGYPMDTVSISNQGKLMATSPSNVTFFQVSSNVYSTTQISGYPGLSGGPLFVLADSGDYYPAGIYLGPSQSSALLVRGLTSDAANLINLADLSATSRLSVPLPIFGGAPNPGIGSTNVQSLTENSMFPGFLEVDTGPTNALAAGGGWKVAGDTSWQTGPSNHVTIPGLSTVTIQFKCIPTGDYALPFRRPDQVINLAAGALYMVSLPYLPPPPPYSLKMTNQVGVTLSGGTMNYAYEVEYTSSLNGIPTWTLLTTAPVKITAPGDVFIPVSAGPGNRFYRARWETCPTQ